MMKSLKGHLAPLLIFAVVLTLFARDDLRPVDELLYRTYAAVASPELSDSNIVLIDIDSQSLAKLGPWPWDNHHFVQVVEYLARFKPKAMGLLEVTPDGAVNELQAYIKAALDKTANKAAKSLLVDALRSIDSDYRLVGTVAKSSSLFVGLPVVALAADGGKPNDAVEAFFLLDKKLPLATPSTLEKALAFGSSWLLPAPVRLRTSVSLDRALYQESKSTSPYFDKFRWFSPVAFAVDEHRLPSMAVTLAAHALGLGAIDIALNGRLNLKLGDLTVATGSALSIWPGFEHRNLRTLPLSQVMDGKIAAKVLQDKVLLVGRLEQGYMQPMGSAVASLMGGEALSSSSLAYTISLGLMVCLLVFWLVLVPSRPEIQWSMLVGAYFLALPLLLWWLATFMSIWLPLSAPLTLLALLLLSKAVQSFSLGQSDQQLQKSLSTVRTSLASLQIDSKQLDAAWKTLRKVDPTPPGLRALVRLGDCFEKQQRHSDAIRVFQHLLKIKPVHREATRRLKALEKSKHQLAALDSTQVSSQPAIMLAQPETLGRFKVESEIGRGAMAVVYKAMDARLDRPVAIKAIPLDQVPADAHARELQQRFFREAKTAGRLSHPDIVTVYDVGEDGGLAYIAMDYLVGEDLSHRVKGKQKLPLNMVLRIGARVADALQYAHDSNVVHRDIKPANIVFDQNNNKITVTDFGVACLVDSSKTKTGTVLGSPSYMSPEQISGKHVDGRADLFSLGVSMFQLLSGKLPYTGDSLANVMYKITRGQADRLEIYCPDLPLEVVELVEKAMDYRISKRFQTGSEMADAIRHCLASISQAGTIG